MSDPHTVISPPRPGLLGRRHRHADDAYRGSRVIDGQHRTVGKVRDVVCDPHGVPRYAVVRLGWRARSRYVPLDRCSFTLDREIVVPFDRRTVSLSPEAASGADLSPSAERVVEQYYRLAS